MEFEFCLEGNADPLINVCLCFKGRTLRILQAGRVRDGRGGRDNARVSVRAAGRRKLALLSLLHLISSFSKLFSAPFCWSDEDTASVSRWADSPSHTQAVPGVRLGTRLGTPKLQPGQAQACAAGRQPGGGQARSLFI